MALVKEEISKNEALARSVAVSGKTPTPPWKRKVFPELVCDIRCIEDRKMQTVAQRKCIAVKYIKARFPPTLWTHAYTDGSAKGAT
jgi:hypothetical protein